ncbi:translation initiation factor eIF-2B subunit delta isoform X2 [Scaptodrosophila lebanonensis]|uniref:Translation initiation factor eIF2B subunit delta n=1 Tax=Drosophila lebanonensis TaxID=7225 RepID=A0A6J2TNN4_DROLE|nr:translation initiation factor eIF-2B subunit delta isoform X2 [Scaptodrosophila lebanonensis]
MVITSEQVPQSASESTSTDPGAPKRRKPRQRNRPRNKRNRVEDKEIETVQHSLQMETSIPTVKKLSGQSTHESALIAATDKTREQIMAEREAKKQAKHNKKNQSKTVPTPPTTKIITEVEQTTITTRLTTTTTTTNDRQEQLATTVAAAVPTKTTSVTSTTTLELGENTREKIKAEREAKKAAKQAVKSAKVSGGNVDAAAQKLANLQIQTAGATEAAESEKPALSKAERRAIQEAQRAAKAQGKAKKDTTKTLTAGAPGSQAISPPTSTIGSKEIKRDNDSPSKIEGSPVKSVPSKTERDHNVKLFNHLLCTSKDASQFINDPLVHPSMARLGEQYAKRIVVGSNARCIAFLNALRQVVQDFETPAKKEFGRSLDVTVKHHVDHLHKCRPLAVSVSNAYKQFKNQLTQLPVDKPETELKDLLSHFIDTYIENQIGKAAQAISGFLQEKITNGDVLLTFGCSSLIHYICEEAKRRQVAFRVIVVDSRPFCEGQEMLRRLSADGIPCTYVLINAISYVMPEATKVLLGAHALLANGYVMARTGTAQVALVANAHNVPVLVCCETHKFSERFQTDAIVYNELGDPNELVRSDKCCLLNWQTKSRMTPLNLNYDITPPELVSAVVTEVAILPCTSVPVILRIKPEIGY